MPEPPNDVRGDRTRPRYWRLRAVARITAEVLLSLADRLIPKSRDRVLIGSNAGLSLNGNALSLFHYLKDSGRGDVRVVTDAEDVVSDIGTRYPGSCLPSRSWRCVWWGLRSQSLCMTHTRLDLGALRYLRGPRFVYLTHGIPMKAMGYDKAYHDPFVARHASSFRAITCCSEFEATRWRESYRLPLSRTWITGAARNDQLMSPPPPVISRLGIRAQGPLVLYAPTFRESGPLTSYLPGPDVDVEKLVALLERHDATLLVRAHPMDAAAARRSLAQIGSPRVAIADSSRIDNSHELLPWVDVLVTDYSSIYIDYLLLDRPLIFTCHDLEDYQRDRGLGMDYLGLTPGEHVRDGATFLTALEDELAGQDPHADERAAVRKLFHAHTDARSCERIADRLLS